MRPRFTEAARLADEEWAEPEARAGTDCLDGGRRTGHVVEDSRRTAVPGAAGGDAARVPAVVDDAERFDRVTVGEFDDCGRVLEDGLLVEVLAVRVVPVVGPDY